MYNINHINSDFWWDLGHNYDNNTKCIIIKKLAGDVKKCYFTAGLMLSLEMILIAYFGKGKVKPMQVAIKN